MPTARSFTALLASAALLAFAAPCANAAGPPQITESFISEVTASSAHLHALINPNGLSTTYRFEYVTQSAWEANGFAGAAKVPASGAAFIGAGTSPLAVVQSLSPPLNALAPATAYRYRTVATNTTTTIGPEHVFATQESSLSFSLPDDRGWELVSPPQKGGGEIAAPGALFGGGDLQASAGGGAVSYGSSTSFGQAAGAPPVSQYVSRRSESGWETENVSAPLASAAYGDHPDGAPYRLFSTDLSKSLLFGGLPCRGGIEDCPAPNPVIAGSGAPPGHMAYYLRGEGGDFSSLLSAADLSHSAVSPERFAVSLAAATPNLAHVVLSSCAKLTAEAKEILSGPGECNGAEQNLYEKSGGTLSLINLLPGESEGTPGAQIAAPIGAISSDGSHVYFTTFEDGYLYLREAGKPTKWVSEAVGGGAIFQAASADGSVAYFIHAGHLYRYLAAASTATDITPAGEVKGVLGASADGTRVYFQDTIGLRLWHEGTTTTIAPGSEAVPPSDYLPPTAGTARVSLDGQHLGFLSSEELTAYDNAGRSEVYLYGPPLGGGAAQLLCASCNPSGERPKGSASISAALVNGSTVAYRSRALSANGSRLFFDSADVLAVGDSDNQPDVYEWEAQGLGDCTRSPGCIGIVSSGRSLDGASFVDASEDGSDVFFLTGESLVGADPGSVDLYDARVGGGFPEAEKPIACIADACQSLPAPPDDPTPGTLTKNSGNPPLAYVSAKPKKHHRKKKGKGKGKKHGKGHGGKGR